MKEIRISVRNKTAMNLKNDTYVCDNSDYRVVFDFDAEWDEHSVKTARFKYNGVFQDVVFSGSACNMPLIRDSRLIYIGVYAGNLQTSTPAVVHASQSILSGDAVHTEPEEDVYHQLVELVESGVLQGPGGKSAYDIAVENGYAGSETEWLASLHGAPGETPEYGVDYGTQEQITEIANRAAEVLADDIKKISDGKVDKVEGKGLSSNDYDNAAKAKVDAIPEDPKYTDTVTPVDATLSKDGEAADAKATGDTLNQIKNELSDKLPKSPANWEPWTAEEQAAARERIGEQKYELLEEITLDGTEAQLVRDYTDNPYKKIMLKTETPATAVSMSVRYHLNNAYIIDSSDIGDSSYAYKHIARFELGNGLLTTLLIGNRGSDANRFYLATSIRGIGFFLDRIDKIKLNITNPVEGAKIYIYGVRG